MKILSGGALSIMQISRIVVLILLCFILVNSCSDIFHRPEPVTDSPLEVDNSHVEQDISPDIELSPIDIDIEVDEEIEEVENNNYLYESGLFEVGKDIPSGIYMLINDSTNDSRVSIKNEIGNNNAVSEKPKILVTARYMNEKRAFAKRDDYVESVTVSGGIPIMPDDDKLFGNALRNGDIRDVFTLAEKYDGLLLTGGGDVAAHFFGQEQHPAANPPDEKLDRVELALTRAFASVNKPVLGICRGMQVLNIALGGTLIQDIPALLQIPSEMHNDSDARHIVDIVPDTWLYRLFGAQIKVNSTHHQSVDEIAPGFIIAGKTDPVVEAIEYNNLLGVQFHPERLLDEGMLPLFEDFTMRCITVSDYVINRIFTTYTIIEVYDGQRIEVDGAKILNIDSTLQIITDLYKENGFYPEGMYLAGFHLPAGEYKLSVVEDSVFAYYAIYEYANQTQAISSLFTDITLNDEISINLGEGQFIKTKGMIMK